MKRLILASKSPYRKELLERLNLTFDCLPSTVNEDLFKQEITDPSHLADTLAKQKALTVFNKNQDAVVIGSDQVAHYEGQILSKTGSFDKSCQQLEMLQGKTHQLITSVTVIGGHKKIQFQDITSLTMKSLSPLQIKNYVEIDNPIDCAGSYKIEKAGIGLFEKIETHDFSAIVGLPLMTLSKVLAEFEIDYLKNETDLQ